MKLSPHVLSRYCDENMATEGPPALPPMPGNSQGGLSLTSESMKEPPNVNMGWRWPSEITQRIANRGPQEGARRETGRCGVGVLSPPRLPRTQSRHTLVDTALSAGHRSLSSSSEEETGEGGR